MCEKKLLLLQYLPNKQKTYSPNFQIDLRIVWDYFNHEICEGKYEN